MLITNDCIGCKLNTTAAPQKKSAFAGWTNKAALVELEILFGDTEYKYLSGGKVYIKPYIDVPPFMKETYTYNEQEFILVPKLFIVGYVLPLGGTSQSQPMFCNTYDFRGIQQNPPLSPVHTSGTYTIVWTNGNLT